MNTGMRLFCGALLVGLTALASSLPLCRADDDSAAAYPKPSLVPISWELQFTHSDPKRILVNLPGDPVPHAFWYITYSIVNDNTDPNAVDPASERVCYPLFTMRTDDGKLIDANDAVHPSVFDAIKDAEKNKYLEEPTLMGGKILVGQDQKRESVAIWPETSPRMGAFTIFATGMWGETAVAKDSDGNAMKDAKGDEIVLHKTLMMSYHVDGDETHFGRVRKTAEDFVMR
jgi:hypothetical protein